MKTDVMEPYGTKKKRITSSIEPYPDERIKWFVIMLVPDTASCTFMTFFFLPRYTNLLYEWFS